eukprot:1362491-Amorphochlora_amoeboformis.AAC.3
MDGAFGLGGFGVSGSDPFKIAEGSDTPNVFNVPQLETPSSWKEFLMTTENKQKHGVGVPSDQQTFSGAGFGGSQQGMQFDNYHQQPLFGSQQQPQERPTSSVRAKSQPPLGGAPTATPFPMDSEALLKLMTTQGRQQGFNVRYLIGRSECNAVTACRLNEYSMAQNRAFSVRAEDLSERGLMEWILANQGYQYSFSNCFEVLTSVVTIIQEDLDGATFLQWRVIGNPARTMLQTNANLTLPAGRDAHGRDQPFAMQTDCRAPTSPPAYRSDSHVLPQAPAKTPIFPSTYARRTPDLAGTLRNLISNLDARDAPYSNLPAQPRESGARGGGD